MLSNKRLSKDWPMLLVITGCFGVLYGLAYYYRFERTQGETANELMALINAGWFTMSSSSRFVLFLSQVAPLTFVKLGQSMSGIVTVYSLGHVLFFHLVAVICYLLGGKISSIMALLAPILGAEGSFFQWPYAELLYGVGIVLIINALSRKRAPITTKLKWCLVPMVYASHPLAVLLLVMCELLKADLSNPLKPFAKVIVIAIGYILFSWFFSTWTFNYIQSFSVNDYFSGQSSPHNFIQTLNHTVANYELGIIASCLVILMAFGKLRQIGALILSVLTWLVVIVASGHPLPLYTGIMVLWVIYYVLNHMEPFISHSLLSLAIAGLFFTYCFIVVKKSDLFVAKTELVQSMLKELNDYRGTRFVVVSNEVLNKHEIFCSAAFRDETLIHSTIEGKTKTIVFAENLEISVKDASVAGTFGDFRLHMTREDRMLELTNKVFVNCKGVKHLSFYLCDKRLNQRYFNLGSPSNYIKFEPRLLDWKERWRDLFYNQGQQQ